MKCSVEKCEGRVLIYSRALCGKHYRRLRKYGDVETVSKGGRPKLSKKECSIGGCHQPAKARGWCSKHYARWRRYGAAEAGVRRVCLDGPLESFRAKVDQRGPDECWPWTAGTSGNYGQIMWLDGTVWLAHRVAYLLAYGKIPDNGNPDDPIEIDHLCHDLTCKVKPCPHRRCCNPAHLAAVPRSHNTRRAHDGKRCDPGCKCQKHVSRSCEDGCACWKHTIKLACAPGCRCGKHSIRSCEPDCTCGKHQRYAA